MNSLKKYFHNLYDFWNENWLNCKLDSFVVDYLFYFMPLALFLLIIVYSFLPSRFLSPTLFDFITIYFTGLSLSTISIFFKDYILKKHNTQEVYMS